MRNRLVLLPILLLVSATLVMADVYNNGPTDGRTNAWPINFGFANSESFDVGGSGASITGLDFAAWLFPGDILQTVEVAVTSEEFGGTTYFDQVLTFSQGDCFANDLGFNVCTETANFDLNLPRGTFWLTLNNAVLNNGDPVYWDENSGPSSASQNEIGTIYSEAFTLNGTVNGTGTTPEVSSLLLFGTGVVGLLGTFKRKLL